MCATISRKDEKLKLKLEAEEFLLSPVTKSRFQVLDDDADISLEFVPDAKRKTAKALFKWEGEGYSLVKAVPISPLTLAQLKEYEGEYESEELLGSKYRFVVEKGNLVLKFRNAPKAPLKAMAKDKFTSESKNIEFLRSRRNRVTGFLLSVDGAAGIEFNKEK